MTSPLGLFERRTRTAQERLREAGVDVLVLFPSPNLAYLTGFSEEPGERHLLLLVPSDGDPAFVLPELYETEVRETTWVSDLRVWSDGDDPVERLRDTARDLRVADADCVLVDDTMHARFTLDLQGVFDADFGLGSAVLAPLRVRKDDTEVDALRRAARAADATVTALRDLGAAVVGMTENELARTIEELLVENGGSGTSFETHVGSGPNGAKPHHSHGERVVQAGEPVVLDFGTRVAGYPSDQTRTLVFGGEPSEPVERVHEVVQRAQRAGLAAAGPGVPAERVDAAARQVIDDAGYGERFVHRTGHGVGLEVHEEPYIVAGNERPLEPGMVFSVEPGIYLPGEFGVRIEDLVVVTEEGTERLNTTDRGWATGDQS